MEKAGPDGTNQCSSGFFKTIGHISDVEMDTIRNDFDVTGSDKDNIESVHARSKDIPVQESISLVQTVGCLCIFFLILTILLISLYFEDYSVLGSVIVFCSIGLALVFAVKRMRGHRSLYTEY